MTEEIKVEENCDCGCECNCTEEGCKEECGEGCDCSCGEEIPDQVVFDLKNLTVEQFVNNMVMIAKAVGWYVAIPRHSEEEPFEGMVIGDGDYIEKVISGEYAIKDQEIPEVKE